MRGTRVLPGRAVSEVEGVKSIPLVARWLIFGPLALLILLPILNVLFHIEAAMHPALPPLILFVCLFLMFAGVYVAVTGVLKVPGDGAIVITDGLPTKARILSIQMGETKLDIGGADERWLVVLELEVQPEDEPPFEARAEHFVPVLDIPKLQVGDIVDVRYKPRDSAKVAIG